MKIKSVEPIILKIPFTDGSSGTGLFPSTWNELEIVLVKITMEDGLVGWGEGFGYFCSEAVASMISSVLAPILTGRVIDDPRDINIELQKNTVLSGRYGISTFAISAVDIALWDLFAKERGVSISSLLGNKKRSEVQTYASLVRYGNLDLVLKYTEKALKEGFHDIKLHEISMSEIQGVRNTFGNDFSLTVDLNCNWSAEFTRNVIPELIHLKIKWLEEPIFPPEDFQLLADLRSLGLPIAAGENACTSIQFSQMINVKAVDYLQPSITKVGGISEYKIIQDINKSEKISIAPHSPYFGPGFLATLQMAAIDENFSVFEYLFIEPESWVYKNMPLPVNGLIKIPQDIGLGIDPNPEIINRYRVN